MSDFEKWFRSLNANGKTVYFLCNEHKVSEMAWNHQQAIIDEHTEVIKLQDADLRKYEKQIEGLKAQLNNMEACYIGIKKINDEQSAIIQGHFAARQDMQKRIAACAALAVGWNEITWDKTTHWTEGYEEGCYHCSAQIEEVLRGES